MNKKIIQSIAKNIVAEELYTAIMLEDASKIASLVETAIDMIVVEDGERKIFNLTRNTLAQREARAMCASHLNGEWIGATLPDDMHELASLIYLAAID